MCGINHKLVDEVADNIRTGRKKSGINTGLVDVDYLFGGLQRGYFYCLGGRPGMGKSAFALSVVCNAIKSGIFVTYYSVDVKEEIIIERLLLMLSGVEKYGSAVGESEALKAAADLLKGSKLIIDDFSFLNVDEVVDNHNVKDGYKDSELIVIDSIQNLEPHCYRVDEEEISRESQLEYISKELKYLARNKNIVVLGLSQLTVDCELRPDHRPRLSYIRDGSCIEENADVIMLLYRDEYYNSYTDDVHVAELNFAKNKLGSTGTVYLRIAANERFVTMDKI